MKEDPDAEVHRWHWLKMPLNDDVMGNLHSPKNVLLKGMGLMEKTARLRTEMVAGPIIGAALGGAAGAASDKDHRLRNAAIGALGGGVIGGAAGKARLKQKLRNAEEERFFNSLARFSRKSDEFLKSTGKTSRTADERAKKTKAFLRGFDKRMREPGPHSGKVITLKKKDWRNID